MRGIKKVIDDLIREELDDANSKYPQFASPHEGYAVLKEELEELQESLRRMKFYQSRIWELVRGDETPRDVLIDMSHEAHEAVYEAVQVAAMCRKFLAIEPRG